MYLSIMDASSESNLLSPFAFPKISRELSKRIGSSPPMEEMTTAQPATTMMITAAIARTF